MGENVKINLHAGNRCYILKLTRCRQHITLCITLNRNLYISLKFQKLLKNLEDLHEQYDTR
jgi:hypothetical protein